jgi:hypothetical protein
MECFVCGKKLDRGNLCEVHARRLLEALKKGDVISEPSFAHHCAICGAWAGKIIVEDRMTGCYFCADDIEEECRGLGIAAK